jgi:orotidine-5'-phosphate decarboxylase
MTFIQKLTAIQKKTNSLLCIGLDTDISKIPSSIKHHPNPQLEFNKQIIESTSDFVCAYKLNLAFYEAAGKRGYETIQATLEYIPRDIITIADGKRGDIGNTAEQYAKSIFYDWKFDAATVNPYMGKDSVDPFIQDENHCAIVLALTSNAGSRDFQYLDVNGRPFYEHVIAHAIKWNTKNNIGFVVGATHGNELQRIRTMVPDIPLLLPGIGTQQGDIESAVHFGCTRRGNLAMINVSRGIIYASRGDDFAMQARAEGMKMNGIFNTIRDKYFSPLRD